MTDTVQLIIVILILIACVAWIIMRRKKPKRNSCAGCCDADSCPLKDSTCRDGHRAEGRGN